MLTFGQLAQTYVGQRFDRGGRVGAQEVGQGALHGGGVRLAAERRTQLVQTVQRLMAEGAPVAQVTGQPGVDDRRVVVIVQLHDDDVGPVQRDQRVLGVGGHQIGEVR